VTVLLVNLCFTIIPPPLEVAGLVLVDLLLIIQGLSRILLHQIKFRCFVSNFLDLLAMSLLKSLAFPLAEHICFVDQGYYMTILYMYGAQRGQGRRLAQATYSMPVRLEHSHLRVGLVLPGGSIMLSWW
jgi:hypothetical protein